MKPKKQVIVFFKEVPENKLEQLRISISDAATLVNAKSDFQVRSVRDDAAFLEDDDLEGERLAAKKSIEEPPEEYR